MRTAVPLLLAVLSAAPALAAEGSSPLETELLDDASDRILAKFDLLEAGLVASGVKDRSELDAAHARLRDQLDPVLRAVPRGDRAVMARTLLQLLHAGLPKAKPMLKVYEPRSTTLLDVLDGRFNCVSATLLYVAAARELALDARAVLLPSHARAAVILGGRTVIVETTNRNGFDASAETAREVQARFRPPPSEGSSIDLYADERGTEVDDFALLGVVYSNLSVGAKQRGDLAAAEALDARADLLVAPSARPLMRLVRASTLGELSILRLGEGKTVEAVELALQAAQLVPGGDEARLARHNLKAMAQRRMDEMKSASEKELLAYADRFKQFPEIERDLRSRAWNVIGGLRSQRGDFEGASQAAREAARLGSGSRNGVVLSHNLAVAELNRLAEVSKKDPDRAWAEWEKLEVPPELETSRKHLGANLAGARAQRSLDKGDCGQLDRRLIDLIILQPTAPADAMRAACKNDEGLVHWKAGDFSLAARAFREAMRLNPDEKAFPKNLSGALGNDVNRLLQAKKCREARPLIEEGRKEFPDDPLFQKAEEFCAR